MNKRCSGNTRYEKRALIGGEPEYFWKECRTKAKYYYVFPGDGTSSGKDELLFQRCERHRAIISVESGERLQEFSREELIVWEVMHS